MSISMPLASAARAPGKMRGYELSLGTIQLLIFFISWILFVYGFPVESVFIIAIIASIFMFFARLIITSNLVGIRILYYLKNVVVPVLTIFLLSGLFSIVIKKWLSPSLMTSFKIILLSIIISIICMFFLGLDKKLKDLIKEKFKKNFNR